MKKMAKAAALLAAMVLAAAAFAQDFPSYLKMEGTKITGYDKASLPANLVIPKGVTEIGRDAFFNAKLKSVVIPESVTKLDDDAFHGSGLVGASVTIPASVTEIGFGAFEGCNFTSVVISDGVTSISDSIFNGCKKLASVTIPGSVTEIGEYAFYDCEKLASVTILDGVTFIGECVFSKCKSLESVEIPTSVKKISDEAFYGCDNLKEVKYAGTKAQWKKVKKSGETSLEGKTVVCTDGDVTVRANVLKKLLELKSRPAVISARTGFRPAHAGRSMYFFKRFSAVLIAAMFLMAAAFGTPTPIAKVV